VHAEKRAAELARILRLPEATQALPVPEKLETRIGRWLESKQLTGKRIVLMHAGCSQAWVTKRWPAAHFIQTARTLADNGYHVLWLGTREEASLNSGLSGQTGTDATDQFSLDELFALGRHAAFAVTNDSGPMHVLAAAGLPVYALFGPIDPARSHAFGQRERVIYRRLPCQPCYSKTCRLPGQTHDCLAGLGSDVVLSRLHADGWL
jgi:ADP-heptose:LPS heptosyltransferase